MQRAVEELVKLGPLPHSTSAPAAKLEEFQHLLTQVNLPISDDEARALVKLLGSDDCFGLAWTILHIVETAPGWPLRDAMIETQGEWRETLMKRCN